MVAEKLGLPHEAAVGLPASILTELVDPYTPWGECDLGGCEDPKTQSPEGIPILKQTFSGLSVDQLVGAVCTMKTPAESWVLFASADFGQGLNTLGRINLVGALRMKRCACVITPGALSSEVEMSLKRQGILPLTLIADSEYEQINESQRVIVRSMRDFFGVQSPDEIEPRHANGIIIIQVVVAPRRFNCLMVSHTLTLAQRDWFRAGSKRKAEEK